MEQNSKVFIIIKDERAKRDGGQKINLELTTKVIQKEAEGLAGNKNLPHSAVGSWQLAVGSLEPVKDRTRMTRIGRIFTNNYSA
jgi:hypothetical protein